MCGIICEINVLVIYLCFKIYFLIGDHCKTQSETFNNLAKYQKCLMFLQGVVRLLFRHLWLVGLPKLFVEGFFGLLI